MRIGGLLKFTLIDFPGKVAAVVFTQGCDFRCPFCHNPELVVPELFHPSLPESDIFDFLKKRQGQLEGVVVSGGEPTLHADLPEFLQAIKDLGFLVKLDTNGSRPEMLRDILDRRLVDYWAMDIKSSPENYEQATGVAVDEFAIRMSAELIKNSGIPYEFRTTAFKEIFSLSDAERVVSILGPGTKYKIRRGDLGEKILNIGFFADKPDYSEMEWQAIVHTVSQG